MVVSAGAGAIALGFPVIVDQDIGDLQVPGALEAVTNHEETVKRSLALRNIKIKVKELPIPVAFAAAFEGEIIRKADMKVEFWSSKNTTCRAARMATVTTWMTLVTSWPRGTTRSSRPIFTPSPRACSMQSPIMKVRMPLDW